MIICVFSDESLGHSFGVIGVLRFFRSNVETWKATSCITQSLQLFIIKCLRRVLCNRWAGRPGLATMRGGCGRRHFCYSSRRLPKTE